MRKLLACLLVLSIPSLCAAQRGPLIHCGATTWDFGAKPQNQEYKHLFKIENRGDQELAIKSVLPSCNCAAGLPKKRHLQPGESTDIEVTMKTLQFKGRIDKVVTIITNCRVMPQLKLNVTGEVLPPYYVKPVQLSFGKFSKSEASKKLSFLIVQTPAIPINVKDVVSSGDNLLIEKGAVEKRADGSVAHHYMAQVKKGTRVGLLRESITVVTDLKAQPRIAVGVTADVSGEVLLSLQNLNFGACKSTSGKSKELVVTKSGAADLDISSVTVRPEGRFDTALEVLEKGRKFKIRVTLRKDAKPGYVKGSVDIKTNCPGEELVRAWFHAFVTK